MFLRGLVTLCVLSIFFGCTGKTDSDRENRQGELQTPATATPGWLELSDLSFHPQNVAVAPRGLYIEGTLAGEREFTPVSSIKGTASGPVPTTDITPGWVELHGLQFFPDQTAVAPKEPFVHGVRDDEGRFHPDSPYEIVGGPQG